MSVNNYGEVAVLTSSLALTDLQTSEPLLTSGVSLRPGSWMWFGAGENITDTEVRFQFLFDELF